MPLMANQPAAGAMPTGSDDGTGTVLASATSPDGTGTSAGQQGGTSGNQWMPVFQIGTGNPGVPNDARGLISGMGAAAAQTAVPQATANAAQSAVTQGIAANTPATTSAGSATGTGSTSGGAASSVPSGSGQDGTGSGASDNTTPGYPQQNDLPGDNAGAVNSPYDNLPPADG